MKTLRITALLVFGLLSAAGVQEGGQSTGGQKTPPLPRNRQEMQKRCQEVKQEWEKMIARMKKEHAKLNDLTAKMNSSAGQNKIEDMAAVINEMVEQQDTLWNTFAEIHQQITQHLMQHMQMGDKDAMGDCPLSKGMGPSGGNQ